MKLFLPVALCCLSILSVNSFAQTITAKPIYTGSRSLKIEEMNNGAIIFLYQNPDYATIVDILSLSVSSKKKAIELINKAISIIGMPKTDSQQDIIDELYGVALVRYGFAQGNVYLSNNVDRSLGLDLVECNKIKTALEAYQYSHQLSE